MKKIFLTLFAAITLITFFSCSKSQSGKLEGGIRIAGGTAHLNVLKEIARKIMKDNSSINISIAGGGSGVGIKQVGEGIVEIGNSGRDLEESEIKKYGLVPHKMAIDGIAVIVNPKSKLSTLTSEQIKNIFSGRIKNWKELSGENKTINVYTRDAKSGTRKTFEKLLIGKGIKMVPSANFVKSNGEMKTNIANDVDAIGYTSVGYLDKTVKALAVDNIAPTIVNVKSQIYKVQRYLYMVTKGEPEGITKLFIDTVLSEYGQNVVKNNHFIPAR